MYANQGKELLQHVTQSLVIVNGERARVFFYQPCEVIHSQRMSCNHTMNLPGYNMWLRNDSTPDMTSVCVNISMCLIALRGFAKFIDAYVQIKASIDIGYSQRLATTP